MRLTIRCLALYVALSLFCVQLVAASHKMFPANHGSVTLENHYADNFAAPRYRSLADVGDAARDGELVGIPITVSGKLPSERRYIRPAAASFMLELDTRFYLATGRFLIVDSAVRPVEVQNRLRRHNRNAAPAVGERASSHERGTTFDLAKKVFKNGNVDRMRMSHYRWLLIQLAYYQAIGRIHVIEERACLHVMVREDDYGYSRIVQTENPVWSEGNGDELHSVQPQDGDRWESRRPVSFGGEATGSYRIPDSRWDMWTLSPVRREIKYILRIDATE